MKLWNTFTYAVVMAWPWLGRQFGVFACGACRSVQPINSWGDCDHCAWRRLQGLALKSTRAQILRRRKEP